MFLYLGFLKNKKEKTTCLGLIFYSVNMLLSVTDDKKEKIYKSFNSYLEKRVFEDWRNIQSYLNLNCYFSMKQGSSPVL